MEGEGGGEAMRRYEGRGRAEALREAVRRAGFYNWGVVWRLNKKVRLRIRDCAYKK